MNGWVEVNEVVMRLYKKNHDVIVFTYLHELCFYLIVQHRNKIQNQ